MGSIFSFSLVVALTLLLIFPVIYFSVTKSNAFHYNRMVVMGGVFISLLAGVFYFSLDYKIEGNIASPLSMDVIDQPTLQSVIPEIKNVGGNYTNVLSWIVLVYLIGMTIVFIHCCISYIKLFVFISKTDKIEREGYTFCLTKEDIMTPFSWGKYIVVAETLYKSCPDVMIMHEKAHVDKQHWLDIFIIDLFCIVQWFNPLAWKLRVLSKLNHEFEADSVVVSSGADVVDYQKTLIMEAMNRPRLPVANYFISGTKLFRRRVLIMNTVLSEPKRRWIGLLFMPTLVLVGLILSSPISGNVIAKVSHTDLKGDLIFRSNELPAKEISSEMKSELSEVAPSPFYTTEYDKSPELKGGSLSLMKHLMTNLKYPEEAVAKKITGKVIVGVDVSESGKVMGMSIEKSVSDELDNEAIRVISLIDYFEPGTKDGNPVNCHIQIPITFKL